MVLKSKKQRVLGIKRSSASSSSSTNTTDFDVVVSVVKMVFQQFVLRELEQVSEKEFLDLLLTSTVRKKNAKPQDVLKSLVMSTRHRICGHTFGTDEIAFSCRTCRTDPSCVICKTCFTQRYVHS